MQPYFLPYIGYFSLIRYSDQWIVFDTVQYIRHGWINRNRILKPEDGWQYIVVPLKNHSNRAQIKDLEISSTQDWKGKILRQVEHYKKTAPFYEEADRLLQEWLYIEEESISRYNALLMKKICDYLDIPFRFAFFSEMKLDLGTIREPQEWALRISEKLSAEEYVNPPGGMEFFDRERFKNTGIKLTFLRNRLKPYNQKRKSFEPGLSILDVLLFNAKEQIREMIDDYELL